MITDGQRVRALESNAAWASKQNDNTMLGQQTLARVGSGPTIVDVQQKINDIEVDVTQAQVDIVQLQTDVSDLQALDTFVYVGQWDALTNTPTLADGDGALPSGIGSTYRVSVSGTQDLGSGPVTYAVGDKLVYNLSGVYEKWDVSDEVTSVNGQAGAVVLSLDDIDDVVETSTQNRDVLAFNGTNWINKNLDSSANDSATGANVTLSSVQSSIVRLTNASLLSIDMIPAGFSGQKFILINATGVDVDVLNDTGATLANRILTGTGLPITLEPDSNLWLTYDATSLRWRVVGGSGAGGGFVGFQEPLGGAVNGINVTFGPLTYEPSSDESIQVFIDGVLLAFDAWTKSGSNIVLDTAPTAGQSVYAFYLTGGGVALPSISGIFKVEYRTITSGEASADQLVLANSPAVPSEVMFDVIGGTSLFYTDDFTVTGTTLDWSPVSGLFTAGDKVRITYVY